MLKGQTIDRSRAVSRTCVVCGRPFLAPARPANRKRCGECPASRLPARKAVLAKYATTQKRRDCLKRYNRSEKARRVARRYRSTKKGKESRRRENRSPLGLMRRARYLSSVKGREARRRILARRNARKWRERDPAMMRAQARYRASEKHKLRACQCQWRKRFGRTVAAELMPWLCELRLLRKWLRQERPAPPVA